MRVRRKTDVQDEAVGVRCYPGQIAQIVILETDHPARPVTLINFSKGVEKDPVVCLLVVVVAPKA